MCNVKHRLGCKYSSQNIFNAKNFNLHKKQTNPVVEFVHLHPDYAANLVTSSKYYHCHWIPLSNRFEILHRARLYLYATLQNELTNEMDVLDERESARFGFKIGQLSYITTVHWLSCFVFCSHHVWCRLWHHCARHHSNRCGVCTGPNKAVRRRCKTFIL